MTTDTVSLERPRAKRWPIVALGGTVAVIVVALVASVFVGSLVYYLSPTEALAREHDEEIIRVSGTVVPGSIEFHPERGAVTFLVSDGVTEMLVDHEGPAPDTLKDNAEAVVEGELLADDTFQAIKVFAKCPSKFESASSEER